MKDIGLKLKRIRNIFGYSQEQVAFHCGITQAAYSNKENGTKIPSTERLIQLAKLYEIHFSQFIDLDMNELSILAHKIQIEKLKK